MKDDLSRKESIVNIRIEHDIKEDSRSVLYKYGLSHSKAIRYFLEFIVNTEKLPDVLKEFIEFKENKKLD